MFLIFTKVFYSGTEGKTFTTHSLIKILETAFDNEEIHADLMIHTDRASQFTSKKYVEFIENKPLLIGSHTAGGQPNQNPIAERMNHTFKNQLKHLKMDLPKNVKRTRDLQAFCDKRRNKMNSAVIYAKNNGLTVEESSKQLSKSTLVEPEILLARECEMFPQTQEAVNIRDYKKSVRFSSLAEPTGAYEILDNVQANTMANQHMLINQHFSIKDLKNDVQEVLRAVTPKKRSTNKAQLLRDPVPKTMLETIINASKPKGSHQLSWARFQITAVLLFFSGLRISELAIVSEKMILDVLKDGRMTFYQSKVNKYRTIRFTSHGIDAIKLVFDKNRDIIFNQKQVLFPVDKTKNLTSEKFTRSINKYLKMFNDKENLKISSHSFRIGFVTNSLKHTNAQNAQQLIGHADIRSTMKYSRYELDPERQDNILNQMFE